MSKIILTLLMTAIISQAQAITIKGKIDTLCNSNKDSVYVGLIWHSDDGPSYNPSYSTEVGVVKNGKFKLKVRKYPPKSSRLKFENSEMSVAYIVLFKDIDGNGRFTKPDKVMGICEKHCLTFVSGTLNKDLDDVGKKKGKKIRLFRRIKNGLNFCTVQKPEEHGLDRTFDDLVTTRKSKVIITTIAGGKKPKSPNWT